MLAVVALGLPSALASACTSAAYCPATCAGTSWAGAGAVPMAGSLRMLTGNSTGERQLKASVIRMVDAVSNRFGPVRNDMSGGLHLSFQYLCCFNGTELPRVAAAMATVRWQPIRVSFTRVFCAGSMALALADPAAQGALLGVVSAIEEAMVVAGLGVRIRCRAEQAPFHASLFAVDAGNTTDLAAVIALAQSTIPAGGSLNAEPILIESFTFNGKTFPSTATTAPALHSSHPAGAAPLTAPRHRSTLAPTQISVAPSLSPRAHPGLPSPPALRTVTLSNVTLPTDNATNTPII